MNKYSLGLYIYTMGTFHSYSYVP